MNSQLKFLNFVFLFFKSFPKWQKKVEAGGGTLASDMTLNFGTVCPILKIQRAKQVRF